MAQPNHRKLLTIPDAAALCAEHGLAFMDEQWFRNQIGRGTFPSSKVGHRRVVRQDIVLKRIETGLEKAA